MWRGVVFELERRYCRCGFVGRVPAALLVPLSRCSRSCLCISAYNRRAVGPSVSSRVWGGDHCSAAIPKRICLPEPVTVAAEVDEAATAIVDVAGAASVLETMEFVAPVAAASPTRYSVGDGGGMGSRHCSRCLLCFCSSSNSSNGRSNRTEREQMQR